MRNGRSTLYLLIGTLVLGGFIGIQEYWRARSPAGEYQKFMLFDLSADSLVSIRFEYTNAVVECVKESGVWMTGGGERGLGRADEALVQRMVFDLDSLVKSTTITAKHLEMRGFDSGEYGFDQPQLKIVAFDHRGRHEWIVGRTTPLGDMVYVKKADRPDIYTISGRLLAIAPTRVDQFRDRTLFAGKISGIRRVEVRGQNGFVQIVKDAKAGWQIQQPILALADSSAVDAFLGKLYKLHIDEFIAENVSDLAIYGLQGETKQISLGGADGTSRMLVLGDVVADRAGFVYARRADDTSVFALGAEVLDLLKIEIDDFRDVRVMTVPAAEVSYISVARGKEQLELVFNAQRNKWIVTKPVVWDADYRAVADLLNSWGQAVITEFNDPVTQEAAEWILEFATPAGSRTNLIHVLPTNGKTDGLRMIRDGEQPVYQINIASVPTSVTDPLQYKDKLVWQLKKDEVQKIARVKPDQARQVVERQADGLFVPVESSGNLPINDKAVEKMLDKLTSVSASGYVVYNPRDVSIYGLENPSIELHVGLTGTNQLGQVLLIGREVPEGFYAMVRGRDVVFMLDKQSVAVLGADLVAVKEETAVNVE